MTDVAEATQAAPTSEVFSVARFGTPDLADKGIWMARRIREKYPHRQDRWIVGWLGGRTSLNDYFFVTTKNAVLMAQLFYGELDGEPSVRILFVLVKDPKDKDHLAEGAFLYAETVKWASNLGATKVIDLDLFSDVPKPFIQGAIGGRLSLNDGLFVKLKK